jgi:hypothetical protein
LSYDCCFSLTSRGLEDKLVEGEDFTSSFKDSSSGSLSYSESSNGKLGHIQKSHIISHSTNDNYGLLSIIYANLIFYYFLSIIKWMNNCKICHYCYPKCFTSLDRETGGLLTLDAINLLSTVLLNAESVLLAKNLKS